MKGVRDTLEMYATGRPKIQYFPTDSGGQAAEPYVIVGDRVRFKGDDRIFAGGKVTVDRSDFASRSDSLRLDTGSRKRRHAHRRAARSSGASAPTASRSPATGSTSRSTSGI